MRCGRKAVSHLGYGFFGWLILKITLKKALGFFIKRGKEGWGFVLGGPPRAALERREFKKVTLFPVLESQFFICVGFSN